MSTITQSTTTSDTRAEGMRLSRGYRRTDAGVIPDDWKVRAIEFCATIKTGARNTQDRQEDGEYPFFVRSQTVERIDSYSFDGEAVLTAGDGVGTGKVFHYINGRFDVHQRVYRIADFDSNLDGRFFYYQFSTRFYDRIMSMTAKSSVDSVRMDMIARMRIPLPGIDEQRAIAAALSDVDELIGALDKLIAKKRAIKLATMQQLLTGKARLPGFGDNSACKRTEIGVAPQDWTVASLGSLGSFKNGINKNKDDFGHGFPFVNLMDVFGIPRISSNAGFGLVNSTHGDRSAYVLRSGDVLFVRSSVKPEGVGLTTLIAADLPDTVFSGFLIRFRDDGELAHDFKSHCFWESAFRNRIISSSTVSANTNINQQSLKSVKLAFPPDKREQSSIATILSDMDAEIAALERRRDKTKAIKQGMMQSLLTGRVRLVEPEATP